MTSVLDCVNESVETCLKDLLKAAELAAQIGTEDEKNPIKYMTLAEQLLKARVNIILLNS